MATTFEYKNKFGKSLTKEQLSITEDYSELIKEDNLLKIEKSYVENNLEHVIYYRDTNEPIQDINSKFPNDLTINIRTLDQIFGSYRMIKEENYFNGELICAGQILEDNIGRQIFFQDINITNGNPIPGTVSKCFYFNEDEYYPFDYNSDGTIKSMDSTYNKNAGCWYLNDLNDLDGFSWSEVGSYYQNANPVIPGTPV